MDITTTAEWHALVEHRDAGVPPLRKLFADESDRLRRLAVDAGDLHIDLSKQRLDRTALDLLLALARRAGVEARREAMFTGEAINTTEHRSVLHTALRAQRQARVIVDGRNVVDDVYAVLDRMRTFSDRVRSGGWRGATGLSIRTIVNIGIGGSDLGPSMAYHAMRNWSDRRLSCRFVSNVDGSDLVEATLDADPASTLFIVSSKTFTTLETMENARSARTWLTASLGEEAVSQHFVAVSTNGDEVKRFGIALENMFGFWDWVGGRYSMDGAIGLSVMIAIGADAFESMLDGFRAIDDHFRSAPLEQNAPVLMGLAGIWERNFLGSPSHAVVPYCNELALFPAYLQQLDMESNGKHVRLDGSRVTYETGPIVWGTPGTNGQHAYFQLLHQGTTVVPLDLIGFMRPVHALGRHHDLLMANLLAQAEALAFGRSADEVSAAGIAKDLVAHRTFEGNRPTTAILGPQLSPFALGELIALYEHKVFVQGTIWDINSFDQWGVELGKALAVGIIDELAEASPAQLDASETQLDASETRHDASTNDLMDRYRAGRPPR